MQEDCPPLPEIETNLSYPLLNHTNLQKAMQYMMT